MSFEATTRLTTVQYDVNSSSSSSSTLKSYTISYSFIPPRIPSPTSESRPTLVFSHPFNNSRHYWLPQLNDPLLSSFPRVFLDAVGFGQSRSGGQPWSFDLTAQAILVILDELQGEGVIDGNAVIIGDSMGGGPTGLRAALKSAERESHGDRVAAKILGVVACGTSAEEESADFVEEYTEAAQDFAKQCLDPSIGPLASIAKLSSDMCDAGYTSSHSPQYSIAHTHGQKVIADSLKLALTDAEGNLTPDFAGKTMLMNYGILNSRQSLVGVLSCRPSRLAKAKVLVIHGTEDAAYPFDRKYHERTVSAIGTENAELYVVEGGPHFVTATHWEEIDKVIVDWIQRNFP